MQILAFDKHFKKKDRGEETVKLMWSTAAAVGHLFWLLDLGPWMGTSWAPCSSVSATNRFPRQAATTPRESIPPSASLVTWLSPR